MDLIHQKIYRFVVVAYTLAAIAVVGSFALVFGYDLPLIHPALLAAVLYLSLAVFLAHKFFRLLIAPSPQFYMRTHVFDFALVLILLTVLFFSAGSENGPVIRHAAIGLYLAAQLVGSTGRTSLTLAAHARDPGSVLLPGFALLLILGTLFLLLPQATARHSVKVIDALFTATSALTLTGLSTRDAEFFGPLGRHVILILIQLGGLAIIIYGASFAFLIGQSFSIRRTETLQDFADMESASHSGRLILFIIVTTLAVEFAGALALVRFFRTIPAFAADTYTLWFSGIFYSVSAFCNAGFTLTSQSLTAIKDSAAITFVICPLIVAGGLGFTVLYNLTVIALDSTNRFFKHLVYKEKTFFAKPRRHPDLQTKIVLVSTLVLIIVPAVFLLIIENNVHRPQNEISFKSTQETIFGTPPEYHFTVFDSFFQSLSARTAGFNTTDIGRLSDPSLALLSVVMLIGGSPVSTAGGIKTVTIAIIIVTAWSLLTRKPNVELARRSIPLAIVGRAVTITLLFVVTLIAAALVLAVTERHSGYTFTQIAFEAASGLSNSGLSSGLTPTLTNAGKVVMIVTMLVGRLGPLVLLSGLTAKLKPVRYNYPEEPVVVG